MMQLLNMDCVAIYDFEYTYVSSYGYLRKNTR